VLVDAQSDYAIVDRGVLGNRQGHFTLSAEVTFAQDRVASGT
jgi:hypothetical protein